jgi:putative nucleotidyltransferase with HDIG domain
MRIAAVQRFVVVTSVLGLLSLQLVPWGDLTDLALPEQLGLALLLAFMLFSERLAVGMAAMSRGSTQALTFIPLLAAVLLFGPVAPVILMGLNSLIVEALLRRKEPIKVIFNVAQYSLATSLAGFMFAFVGGKPVTGSPEFSAQLFPFFLFLVVMLGVNQAAVVSVITLSQGGRLREVWSRFIGPAGVNALYDILVSPLAIVVSYMYWRAGSPGLLFSLLPLLFVRQAYLNSNRLEHANHDLLKVLVKAIETRDPYTSGHSQRVAGLAGLIARSLPLNRRKVELIEMAALLHDIGKIDAVYSEILRKPDKLTSEERAIIESHVMKGVELLRSLHSVPEEVISAVLHHHEREDGRGYPNRLHGEDISLGGKIIKVCDSVDAMLSDRPYRNALTPDEVRRELWENAGREFDVEIVKCVMATRILEEHVDTVRQTTATNVSIPDVPRRPVSVVRFGSSRRIGALTS